MQDQTVCDAESDLVLLRSMLAAGKQLSARNDFFLQAQYVHLTARIHALIELHGCLQMSGVAADA